MKHFPEQTISKPYLFTASTKAHKCEREKERILFLLLSPFYLLTSFYIETVPV